MPGSYNSDAAGGVVIFTPTEQLAINTTYTVETTTGLQDTAGNPFAAFTSTFTTGSSSTPPAPVNFDKTVQADVTGPTAIVIGPDGKLYVGNGIGEIRRYTLDADGTLAASPQTFAPFGPSAARSPASPSSPARRPRTCGCTCPTASSATEDMANFTGKVTLVSGRQPPDRPGQDRRPAPVRPRTT